MARAGGTCSTHVRRARTANAMTFDNAIDALTTFAGTDGLSASSSGWLAKMGNSPAMTNKHPDAQCRAGRFRLGLCAGGPGAAASFRGTSPARARGLVPGVFGLPTSTTQADASIRRRLRCWSMRCAAAALLLFPECRVQVDVSTLHPPLGVIDCDLARQRCETVSFDQPLHESRACGHADRTL